MQTLSLDFNRLDREGRVRIGPEAQERLRPMLSNLAVGNRVLVVDDEGNRCEGVMERPWIPASDWLRGYVVRLDLTTWRDADGDAD